jgi:hypothetical protein
MPISHEALFKVALNLEDPWYITSMDFRKAGVRGQRIPASSEVG